MNNRDGQVLTPKVAQKLIQELFAGQTVHLQQIIRKVDEVHEERRGQLSSAKHHPVPRALSGMKRFGLADNPELGFWSIFAEEQSQSVWSIVEEEQSQSEEPFQSEEQPQLEEQPQSEESDLIESLDAFMKWVRKLLHGDYVYRGVSNKDYLIEASTYRRLKNEKHEFRNEEDKSAERLRQLNWEMIEDANRHRHGWENDRPPSDLDLLAKLQHSGAATCLIDFTKNPLVALWMACRKSGSGSVPGKVYAVEISSGFPFKPVSSDEARNMKINDFFKGNEKTGYQLYQWQPHYQDNRMLAQQSVFLFGGGWGEIKPSKGCVISEQHKKEILDSLKKSAGISVDILFPDFEGFASQRAQNKAYNEQETLIDTEPILALPAIVTDETIDDKKQRESSIHYLQLSLQASREGNTEAAVQHYNKSIEFNPSNELLNDFYRERAVIHHDTGYLESAVFDYSEAIHFADDDVDSYYGRGRANYDLNRYTEAVTDFDSAITLNPNDANIYYWRGLAKYSLDQYSEARVDFDSAITLNPNDAYFYQWRGMTNLQLESYQEAIGNFNRSINLNSTQAYSYHWRGMAKYSLNQHAEAIADFDIAITLNPTDTHSNAYSYYWRGMTKKRIGVSSTAKADFRTALMCAEETQNYDLIAQIHQELLP